MGADLAEAPFTCGASAAVDAAGFSARVGVGIASLTAIVFLDIALIMNINNGHDVKFIAKSDTFGEEIINLNKRKDLLMPKFMPGPPYFFICKACGHHFKRSINWGIICPKCKSLRVMADPTVRK